MTKIGSDISSSEDELLTGGNYSPVDRRGNGKSDKTDKDDDRMSLSSLSDTEQKIEESKLAVMPSVMTQMSGTYPYPQYPGNFFHNFNLLLFLTLLDMHIYGISYVIFVTLDVV